MGKKFSAPVDSQLHILAGIAALRKRRMDEFRRYNDNENAFTFHRGLEKKNPQKLFRLTQVLYGSAYQKLLNFKGIQNFWEKDIRQQSRMLEGVRQAVRENIGEYRRKYARSMKLRFDDEDKNLAPYLADFFLTDPKDEYSYQYIGILLD